MARGLRPVRIAHVGVAVRPPHGSAKVDAVGESFDGHGVFLVS
jgi:hypothetical protein